MPKNPGLYEKALQDHLEGKTLRELQSENPEIKRSTFYSYKKTMQEPKAQPEQQEQASITKPTVKFQLKERAEQQQEPKEQVQRVYQDDFLSHQKPDLFMDVGANSRKESLLAGFGEGGGNSRLASLVNDNFGDIDLFQPDALRQQPYQSQQESIIKGSTIGGHGKSWWSKLKPEIKKRQTPEQQRDEQQMIAVQKVRLYLMHFPKLEQLHIIPVKKSTGEPDVEKFLISLYAKKQADLDKMLDFIQFAVRNQINEQTSTKLATNVITTGSKVLEHILVALGLKVQGLTKNLMEDEDVDRCIKEILIENSINTLNLGPKADLGLKLMMKIVSTDSQNRIEETVKRKAEEKALQLQNKQAEAKEKPKPVSKELNEKYNDL
jgi:hypothetical protein